MTADTTPTVRVLRVQCADATGIIHRVTGVLAAQGLNVIEQEEFVDAPTGRFFLRTAFTGAADDVAVAKAVADVVDDASTTVHVRPRQKRRIAILVTKEAHCVGDLLVRDFSGELNAEIACVVGNHETLRPLVERFGHPFVHVPSDGLSHAEHDAAVLDALDGYQVEFLVFAKYMRIVGQGFIDHYKHRIINIHHSFLPAFIGAKPYHQAYKRGVKIIGATAHFVTGDLDAGPIIAQDVVSVRHSHGLGDMIQSGRNVEKIVLARALRLVFDDRVFVHGNRTVIFD
ncbi:formyltetrahydrofolate deformylase [Sulfuriroseicoccus oceanibius]|uniref:Formyltetrahydrofolate deformylase n=1 Tax=Sulfuriroseicoccus oceanibius TaxID=2707525 RepID=A0A6B3LAT9_9BACT|nr:formyltetrahydrofolate deformylase [Sulfuriroseicoccus oceanibius]QQL45603.1 formyltetrahydrofolate deformylase [Sulfuriroseicoccus oceanibius]